MGGGGGLGGRRGRESKSRRVDESVERKDRDAKASRATPSAERGPSLRAVGSAERGQRLNRSQKLLDSTSGACTAVGPCAMRRHTHTHTYSSAAQGCICHVPRPKFRLVLLASRPRPFFSLLCKRPSDTCLRWSAC